MDLKGMLAEAADDDLSLWEIAIEARRETRKASVQEVRARVLEFLCPLLLGGLLKAGELGPDGGFVAWDDAPDGALERLAAFLAAIERDPTLGDNFYFVATPLGERCVQLLS